MPQMGRHERIGAVLTDDLTSISGLRERTTVSSNPTLAAGPHGRSVSSWDGTDDKALFVGTFSVKTVFIRCYLSSTSEQIIDLDGGTTYIHVVTGTVTPVGFTAPTTYVDGVATTTITADAWHSICVTDTTAETASSVQLATDNVNFGQVRLADMILDDRVWAAAEVLDEHNTDSFDYDNDELGHWTQSNINDPDIGHAGNANDMTGTGLVASTDIVAGPYMGEKATQYNGTDERASAGDVGNIRTISMMVKPDTTTEELIYIDTGKDIMVNGGTVTYTGVTATATFVDGVATTTMVADKWQHLVCVLNADVDANLFGVAYDGTNFGAITCSDIRTYGVELTQIQAKDLGESLKLGF